MPLRTHCTNRPASHAAVIAMVGAVVIALYAMTGCGSEVIVLEERCPPGTTYEEARDRCVVDEVDRDAGDEEDSSTTPDSTYSTDPDVQPQCPLDQCGDQCVDLQTSSEHCGQCNQICDLPRTCREGQCQCAGGEEFCAPDCLDVMSDDQNCGGCGISCPGGEVCVGGECHLSEQVGGVVQAVNAARATENDCGQYGTFSPVGPVEGHPLLHEAAQIHADDLVESGEFSHTGSDGSSFSQRMAAVGYPGMPVGENIAGGGTDPDHVVQRWLDSDGHCRNIMNGSANEIGVGFAHGGQWGTIWVLKLGAR